MKLKKLDYLTVIKYLTLFFVFLVFNNLEKEVLPYSSAVYISAIACGSEIFITTLLYLSSFLILASPGLLGAGAILALISITIILIYKKINRKIKIELTACALIGMLGFVFLGDTARVFSLEKRILTSLITIVLTALCLITGKALCEKGLKFKLHFEELASLFTLIAIFGTGVCNFLSPFFWRAISVFLILIVCYLFKLGTSTIFSSILGIGFSLYYNNVIYVAVFLCLSLSAESLLPLSRYASALAILVTDYFVQLIFKVYPSYNLMEFISILIGAVIFCIIPNKPLQNFKEKLYSFREKQLVRISINRNRTFLSNKLYDLSMVFQEMAGAFKSFEKTAITEDKAKNIMLKQVLENVCTDCENKIKCKTNEKNFKIGLKKLIDIGFAKGKISLIDLPKELSDVCLRPNNILYGINKLLADYRAYTIENLNLKNGREVISSQALGVAEILRTLAIETGSQLKYQSRLERTLAENLLKKGFSISELLIYGEENNLSISLIVTMEEFSIQHIQSIISKTVNKSMILSNSIKITDGKCFLSFNCSSLYDAVYGFSSAVKDGSNKCGDTHSVIKIENQKLLVALADGMGSGEMAENVSSTALSLIESFYKAGLSSPLILNTVNQLLSINTEDTFTALDLAVLDLNYSTVDFIKYGAPYGFIVGDEGVRIVEGNSLPLGILNELKPSVAKTELLDGDVVLLITDGISDAFSSSGDLIDFLRTQPAKNPQTLTDQVLKKAIELNNGLKKDDMSALAVRIFKRKQD